MNAEPSESQHINCAGREACIRVLVECLATVRNADVTFDTMAQNLCLVVEMLERSKAKGSMSTENLSVAIAEIGKIAEDLREGLRSERSEVGDSSRKPH